MMGFGILATIWKFDDEITKLAFEAVEFFDFQGQSCISDDSIDLSNCSYRFLSRFLNIDCGF